MYWFCQKHSETQQPRVKRKLDVKGNWKIIFVLPFSLYLLSNLSFLFSQMAKHFSACWAWENQAYRNSGGINDVVQRRRGKYASIIVMLSTTMFWHKFLRSIRFEEIKIVWSKNVCIRFIAMEKWSFVNSLAARFFSEKLLLKKGCSKLTF